MVIEGVNQRLQAGTQVKIKHTTPYRSLKLVNEV